MLRPFGVKLILLATVLYLVFFVGIQASARNIRLSNKSFFDLGHGAVPGDEPGHQGHRERRTATSADLSADEIADFLDKHNELRGQTVPQASNMKFMVWDDTLATMAQQWSDTCTWDHGQPENISPFSSLGQNLYISGYGSQSNRVDGGGAVQAWYDEDQFYTYDTNACQTNQVCGHYTQVVWANSYAVGCAMSFCPTASGISWTNNWIVTCNYGPPGNYAGTKPFLTGTPCTQCDGGIGQCYANQCRLCSTHSEECVCAQVCENCGTLDSSACSCSCPNGFSGSDCGTVCENTHNYCGANPGWPKSWCDDDHSYVLTNCPALCDLCEADQDPGYSCDPSTAGPAQTNAATTVAATTQPTATNCPSVTCSNGGTFDASSCECQCSPGYQGSTCQTALTTQAPTTACPSLTCSNGGTFDSSSCACQCASEYQGDTCQHEREQARYGVIVILLADINDWDYIEPYLIRFIAYIVTSFCNDRFELCCPGEGSKNTADMLSYVNETHTVTASGYPEPYSSDSDAFLVMFLVTPPATTELCSAGSTGRRRREAETLLDWGGRHTIRKRATGPYLDQDVLLEAIEENMDNLTMSLSSLNVSVSVQGVEAGQEEPVATVVPSTAAPAPTGISTAVIIAIVVAVVVLVAFIVMVVVVCMKVSKKSKIGPDKKNQKTNNNTGRDNIGMDPVA
ncbi:uncharacterized protein [Asterias amurensis]|uniref:uncharacterized protein n=1 Tax=Asterias amurensis TaxID=7602 RepID=UPI003AB76CA4